MELSRARVDDTERAEVIDHLNEQHARGRLDMDELDVRVRSALAAHTMGELYMLVSDLPPRLSPIAARSGSDDWLAKHVSTLLPAACLAAGGFATISVTGQPVVGVIAVAAGFCGVVLGRVTGSRR
ncbi:MAG: DUF1707 SHOCT-like domain-containing protein [Mycobacteriales bacterium]